MAGFQKTIDKNPYLFLIGTVVSAATLSAGVTRYFWQRSEEVQAARHALDLQRLETQLQSINRQVGGAPFLDVKSLFISRREAAALPATVSFLAGAGLYTVQDDYWTHEKIRELDAGFHFLAEDRWNMRETIHKMDVYQKSPFIHLWQGKAPSPARAGVYNLAPFVTVKRVPLSELVVSPDGRTAAPPADGTSPRDLERYYRGDVAGQVFVQTWKTLERFKNQLGTSKASLELVTAQKVGNVFYAQGLMSLAEGALGNKDSPAFYIRTESILFTTATDAFAVQTFIPGVEPLPSGTPVAKVTEWLTHLRIVID